MVFYLVIGSFAEGEAGALEGQQSITTLTIYLLPTVIHTDAH